MIWESWDAFWAMGGYGVYVWGSFGVTLLCIVGEMAWVRRHRRLVWLRLQRMQSWDTQ
jgi:heme exporter protein D